MLSIQDDRIEKTYATRFQWLLTKGGYMTAMSVLSAELD
jgi:hypothetical protein